MERLSSNDAARLLGVKVSSKVAEINKAWRKLARTCHPDLHPEDKEAETKYRKLNLAYTTLISIKEGHRRMCDLGEDIVDNEFDRWIKQLDPEKQERIKRELEELEEDDAI